MLRAAGKPGWWRWRALPREAGAWSSGPSHHCCMTFGKSVTPPVKWTVRGRNFLLRSLLFKVQSQMPASAAPRSLLEVENLSAHLESESVVSQDPQVIHGFIKTYKALVCMIDLTQCPPFCVPPCRTGCLTKGSEESSTERTRVIWFGPALPHV